jgi:hypothetical protein
MAQHHKNRERFLHEAARLYDAFMARSGPESGDTFDHMEVQAETSARTLIVRLLADRLADETEHEPEQVPCPHCGQPMRVPPTPAERCLETASGCVPYKRFHAICDRCGESFSPAGPPAQHPPPGRVEPCTAQSL